jgi:hypothetical protein
MNHEPIPARAGDPPEAIGATTPPATAGETANGSAPRLGQRYPHDYADLLSRPYTPLGTAAAAGGRPAHSRPGGGTGPGQQAPPGWPEYRRD